MSRNRRMRAAAWITWFLAFVLSLGCGLGRDDEQAEPAADRAGRFTPVLPPGALPEPLRALRFGDSTPEHARAVLGSSPRIRVYDARVPHDVVQGALASIELPIRFNDNPRWPNALGAELSLEQEDNTMFAGVERARLYFTMFPGRAGERLVRIDLAPQHRSREAVLAACGPLVALARDAACPPARLARIRAAYSGETYALGCLGDEEGDVQLGVLCSPEGVTIEVLEPATAALRAAPELAIAPPAPLPPSLAPAGTLPPNGPGFYSVPGGWIHGTDPAVACTHGSYTLDGARLSYAVARGDCRLTIQLGQITSSIVAVDASDRAQVTLVGTTVSVTANGVSTGRAALETHDTGTITVRQGSVSHACPACGFTPPAVNATGGDVTLSGVAVSGPARGRVVDGGGNSGLAITP